MKLFPGILASAVEIQDLNLSLELSKVFTLWPTGVIGDMASWKISHARKAVKKETADFIMFCSLLNNK